MNCKTLEVCGFMGAIHGMRNAKKSWDRADSEYITDDILGAPYFEIGPNDMKLAKTLIGAGSSHRKFLRQIMVWVDINAPLYWWKEFDTYKIGTVANSESTMHTIQKDEITLDMFEMDDACMDRNTRIVWDSVIQKCEDLRELFNETKDKKYWKELIRLLPDSFKQTRTVSMNYENLYSIYEQRSGHKLTEWAEFIRWSESLPYAKEFIIH